MKTPDAASRTANACEQTLEIVSVLRDLNEANLTELAIDLDMPRSTLHGSLSAMVNQEYLVKENRTYRLGLKFVKE